MRQWFPSRSAGLILAAALFGLTVGAAVRSFAWYPLRITSNSMLPTVVAGDWVVIAPRRPGSEAPVERGDIVLFTFPFGGDGRAIKRVVAVPGDVVAIAGPNVVLVNGEFVVHGPPERGANETGERSPDTTVRVPEGYYFILGDNVTSSVDSRTLGLLPQTEVLGKVAAVIGKPW